MAWSGFSPDQILGAAIHSSPNPFIKSIGNLLAEITQIDPVSKEALQQGYNPYVDMEINQIAHDRHIEETFEMVGVILFIKALLRYITTRYHEIILLVR